MLDYIKQLEKHNEELQSMTTNLESLINSYKKVEFISYVFTNKKKKDEIDRITFVVSFIGSTQTISLGGLSKYKKKYMWLFEDYTNNGNYTLYNLKDCVVSTDYIEFVMKILALGEIPYKIVNI